MNDKKTLSKENGYKYEIEILSDQDEQSKICMRIPSTGEIYTWRFSSNPEDISEFNDGIGCDLVSLIGRWANAVSYKRNDRLELLGQLIDVVEDFLEEKGVKIQNEERDEYGDDDNCAIIFGSDYDDLSSAFEKILMAWGFIE